MKPEKLELKNYDDLLKANEYIFNALVGGILTVTQVDRLNDVIRNQMQLFLNNNEPSSK